jgi:hypothetical protein
MPKSDKTDLLDNQPPKPWREVWPVAEELIKLGFPRREGEARKAAALDMKLRGINRPILYFNDPVFGDCLIDADGEDRLRIAEEEGLLVVSKYSVRGSEPRFVLEIRVDDGESEPVLREVPFLCLREEIDVYAAIAEASLNNLTLQLTTQKLRDVRYRYVVANHAKSDRQIAGELGCHHSTVGELRSKGIQLAEIRQLETRLGADGKERRLPYIRPATQKALDADEERWEAEEAARLKAEEEEKTKREAEAKRQAAEERAAKQAEAKLALERKAVDEVAPLPEGSQGDAPIKTWLAWAGIRPATVRAERNRVRAPTGPEGRSRSVWGHSSST